MQIKIDVSGLDAVKSAMQKAVKQVPYAASQALNSTAFEINARLKQEMKSTFKGGATQFAMQAFKVDKASKAKLEARVALRTDAPSGGGTPYSKALGHLFTGGTRDWKKLEGYLRGKRLMPSGLMAVPGGGVKLDAKGNIPKATLLEMIGFLGANRGDLRIYQKQGRSKARKAVAYFVVLPGARASKLDPGIYKRLESGNTSKVLPMVLYVRPGSWRKFIDLQAVGNEVMQKSFADHFVRAFERALVTAR